MKTRFLAIAHLPSGYSPADVSEALVRVARESHERGASPVETFYSLEQRRAYTMFEAGSVEAIRSALTAAGLPDAEVVAGERVYTELLDEPRRAR